MAKYSMTTPIIPQFPYILTNGTLADANQVMADLYAIQTGVNANAADSGSNTNITQLTNLTTPLAPSMGGTQWFISGVAGGSDTNLVITPTIPNNFSLVQGYKVSFIASANNTTGSTTLNVNNTGAVNLVKESATGITALISGDLIAAQTYYAEYDGSRFVLINPSTLGAGGGGGGGVASVASGVGINVTGTTSNPVINLIVPAVVANGGTGNTAFNLHQLLVGNGTNAIGQIGAGTAGQVLTSNGPNSDPTFQAPSGGGGAAGAIVSFSNLAVTVTGSTSGTITANEAIVENSSALTLRFGPVSVALNLTTGTSTPTANGMDGHARPISGWGYVWLISNGTVISGLCSTTLTPNLPSGYTYKARVGAWRFDGSGNLLFTKQFGRKAQYIVGTNPSSTLLMAQGPAGNVNGTYVAVAVGAFVPSTAAAISLSLSGGNIGTSIFAPNSSYGGQGPVNSPAQFISPSNSVETTISVTWLLEGTNVWFASTNAAGQMACIGWEDNL